jgi:hypothetical protein
MLTSRGAGAPASALILAGCLMALTSRAFAREEQVEAMAVAYEADPKVCPSEAQFVQSVRRYTTKWKVVAPSSDARLFRIRIVASGNRYAGTMLVIAPDGTRTIREIAGPECAGVARGLAVVMALAIDPQARIAEPAADEPEPPEGAPTTSAAPPPTPSAPATVPSERAPSSADALQSGRSGKPVMTSEGSSTSTPLRLAFAGEGKVELTSAVTATTLVVVGAAMEMRMIFGGLPSWLTPSLALGVRQSLPRAIGLSTGSSEFLWTAGMLRLCPVRFAALEGRLEAAPCAEMNVGVLQADARGIVNARATTNFWLDRGPSVRASVRLTPSWAVGASLLVNAPVTRHRFALLTGQLISQAPAVGATGGLFIELML